MASAAALPSTVRAKLAALARRIRLLRALRGLSLLLLTLVLLGGGALLADHFFTLPDAALGAILVALAGTAAAALVFGVALPLCRRLDPEALAALVEEKYPELGERLTTTVELADAPDAYHGSAGLIALLMQETEARTGPLDFTRAFPARTTTQLVLAAGGALLLAILPGLIWPDRYAELGRRLLLSWVPRGSDAVAGVPSTPRTYTLRVNGGDRYALKGRPLVLSARVLADGPGVTLPETCSLVCTAAGGRTNRYPMSANGKDSYFFKLNEVAGDLRYFVEAGSRRSPVYRVTAVEVTASVTPPAYVNPRSLPGQTVHGLADLSALQYSRVAWTFHYSRPAARAVLQWSAGEARSYQETPLAPAADAQGARTEVPALASGAHAFRLVLEDDHHGRSVLPLQTLTVWKDEPPYFEKSSWKENSRAVSLAETDGRGNLIPLAPKGSDGAGPVRYVPEGQALPLELAAADRVGLGTVGIEYRTGADAKVRFEPVAEGKGLPTLTARHVFSLAGKVKPGETILYRIKLADNRRVARGTFADAAGRPVPDRDLGPNVVYLPRKQGRDRWFALTINPSARTLEQQAVERRRLLRQSQVEAAAREVEDRLQKIREQLVKERQDLGGLRNQAKDRPRLTARQESDLASVRRQNHQNQGALSNLADKLAESPDLLPLAEKARDVADTEMRRSGRALEQAAEHKDRPAERNDRMGKADEQLARALKRLDDLRKQNQELARATLDQLRREALAERQEALARRGTELAARDPVRDPKAQAEKERLLREQDQVSRDLQRLADEDPALKRALNASQTEKARRLAEKARELARRQREIDPRDADSALKDLARRQRELADKAAELARETKKPAQSARAMPLHPDDAKKAAEALEKPNPGEALWRQDLAARELDRLANDLDQAVRKARDPREAALQLARLQEKLHKEVQEEKRKQGAPAAGREERLRQLQARQEAVRRAAEALDVPRARPVPAEDRRQAVKHAAAAADALKNKNLDAAARKANQTRDALYRLSNRLPGLEQRRQQALNEVNQLKQQQDQIARLAEEALKPAAKSDPQAKQAREQRLAEAARRQAEAAERLGKIDPAGHDERHERTRKAVHDALADLMDRRRQDVPASQQAARRQLERLQQALSGQKPVDDKARELAKRQKDLADEARRLARDPKATPRQKQDLQRRQQEVARETRSLPPTEARRRQAEANEATARAEQAANAQPTGDEAQKRMTEAAKALDRLAKRLAGGKSATARTAASKPSAEQARQTARDLARRQQQLANATRQAQNQARRRPGEPGKQALQRALEELARQQQQLNRQAARLPADQNPRAVEQARRAMHQAGQALAQKDAGQAGARQQEAARALQNLARLLTRRQAAAPPPARPRELQSPPRELPNKGQVAKARQLAKAQRELRDEVQRAMNRRNQANQQAQAVSPADLAGQQKEIARQAGELARKVAQDHGQQAEPAGQAKQAAASAHQAARHAGAGDLKAAQESGQQTAGRLRGLARKLGQSTPAKPKAAASAEQAHALADRQDALNRRMQQARQQELLRRTEELAQQFARLGQEVSRSPMAQAHANQAGWSTQTARGSMQNAHNQAQWNNPEQARQAGQQAAQQLDQAARQAEEAARELARAPGRPESGKPGDPKADQQLARSMKDAQGQIHQAQNKLGQGQVQSAQAAMHQAARSLQQVARLGKPGEKPGKPAVNPIPGKKGAAGSGRPDDRMPGRANLMLAGKAWGELPGELRTKILQDMKARYGDDYARIIKLYFEQIADTKAKKK